MIKALKITAERIAPRHQELLADLDHLDQLGRVRVEIDHVPGFFRRLRAGVHGHADIRLRQRWGVVGAISGHGHEIALALLFADQSEFVLRRGLSQEVIDACLAGDECGSERIVASDHDRANAHHPQPVEALLHPAFDDVLEVERADHPVPVGDDERSAAFAGDARHVVLYLVGKRATLRSHELGHRVGCSLADRAAALEVEPRHARPGGEGHEVRAHLMEITSTKAELLFGQDDDGATFRGLIGERGELSDVGENMRFDTGGGHELRGLAIAERDRACLVEQQYIHVPRGFDSAA